MCHTGMSLAFLAVCLPGVSISCQVSNREARIFGCDIYVVPTVSMLHAHTHNITNCIEAH